MSYGRDGYVAYKEPTEVDVVQIGWESNPGVSASTSKFYGSIAMPDDDEESVVVNDPTAAEIW